MTNAQSSHTDCIVRIDTMRLSCNVSSFGIQDALSYGTQSVHKEWQDPALYAQCPTLRDIFRTTGLVHYLWQA